MSKNNIESNVWNQNTNTTEKNSLNGFGKKKNKRTHLLPKKKKRK